MNNNLLTVAQAASYMQFSEKTVLRLIHSGRLKASKLGRRSWRIKASDLEILMAAISYLLMKEIYLTAI